MNNIFVLDACAVITLLRNEAGAEIVEDILLKAEEGKANVYMNAINLLEVYYDFYRCDGKGSADEQLERVQNSIIIINYYISTNLLKEAGRFKTFYKVSLADSFVLAEAFLSDARLVTSDHHEFDNIEKNEPLQFLWTR